MLLAKINQRRISAYKFEKVILFIIFINVYQLECNAQVPSNCTEQIILDETSIVHDANASWNGQFCKTVSEYQQCFESTNKSEDTLKYLIITGIPIDTIEKEECLRMLLISAGSLLQEITIENCSLQHFDTTLLSNQKKLTRLNLASNQLRNLNFTSGLLNKLDYLNISANNISYLDGEEEDISPSSNDKTFDFSDNELEYLRESFILALRASISVLNPNVLFYLQGNPWRKKSCLFYHTWRLLYNLGEQIPENPPDLATCGWDICPLKCDCNEQNKTVDCSSKGLKSIPIIGPSDAEVLLLQNNSIEDASEWLQTSESWCSLKEIHLDRNNLDHIFKSEYIGTCQKVINKKKWNTVLPHLTYISLANNKFKIFSKHDWEFLRKIPRINLSKNKLKSIEFVDYHPKRDFSFITSLDISFNDFSGISKEEFSLFPYLTELDISHNNLEKFDAELSSIFPKLSTLNLANNSISSISPQKLRENKNPYSIYYPNLMNLYLDNNNLQNMFPVIWTTLENFSLTKNPWKCNEKNREAMQAFQWSNFKAGVSKNFLSLVQESDCKIFIQPNVPKTETRKVVRNESIVVLSATVIFSIFTLLLLSKKQINSVKNWFCYSGSSNSEHAEKEYDVFIIYARDAEEHAENYIIPELCQKGYKVSSKSRTFVPGEFIHVQLTETLDKSRKVLIVISEQFKRNELLVSDLRRILDHERSFGTKICAILMDTTVDENCRREIFQIVVERDCIRYNDRNRYERIKRFLGQPMSQEDGLVNGVGCMNYSFEDNTEV